MTSGITTFTLIHVVISVVGIFAGLVVAGGLISGKRLDGGLFILLGFASVKGFRAAPGATAVAAANF